MMRRFKKVFAWISGHRRLAALGAVVLVILGVFLLRTSGKKTQTEIQTQKVERGTIVSSVSASGKALTTSVLSINTQASGVVKTVYVKDGDKVYTGQKIAEITLDSTGQQAYAQALSGYLSAKNSVDSANAGFYSLQSSMFAVNQKFINDAVARSLATDDPTYIQQYADWKAAEAKYIQQSTVLSQSKASLGSASISLQQASPTITAPFAGEISNLELVEGMVIGGSSSSTTTTSSQRVAVIKSQSTPIVSVTLSEVDVPKIKVGQKATITFDSLADKTFTGKVATVDRIGSVSNNVVGYTANIKLDSSSDEILPNMAATANIILETKSDVLLVPSTAIVTQNNQTFARVLKNGKEEQVLVEVGISSDTQTEITSGLSEGDTVISGTISSTTSSSTQTRSVFGGFGGGQVRIAR